MRTYEWGEVDGDKVDAHTQRLPPLAPRQSTAVDGARVDERRQTAAAAGSAVLWAPAATGPLAGLGHAGVVARLSAVDVLWSAVMSVADQLHQTTSWWRTGATSGIVDVQTLTDSREHSTSTPVYTAQHSHNNNKKKNLYYKRAQASERNSPLVNASCQTDRWLRAERHRHLIRVAATRSTPAVARQWYMT